MVYLKSGWLGSVSVIHSDARKTDQQGGVALSRPQPASSASGIRRGVKNDIVAFAILCGVVIALYLSLPRHGDIWNTDASRHALNGVFVLDFLRAMPLRHPIDFALDYYRQWPGLTIGFYPPLFYIVLAVSYAIFGISEAAALV